MQEQGQSWQQWLRLRSFEAKNGSRVYFVYAVGANGERAEGGTIYAHNAEVSLDDVNSPPEAWHRIGSFTWNYGVIQYVDVSKEHGDGWNRQGIGREMLRLAREIEPDLRHAPCTARTEDGERFVRGTDPGGACRDNCEPDCRHWSLQIGMPGEEGLVQSVRRRSVWMKIKRFFGRA